MKIYTRTGDKGDTSLFGGKRVSKASQAIEAYGTVDELNSSLGVVRSHDVSPEVDHYLEAIQRELFTIGANLATPSDANQKLPKLRLAEQAITRLENEIDKMSQELPPLKNFILPSGTKAASLLHLSRAICRRAEREMVKLAEVEEADKIIIKYTNRLSDWLFTAARYQNHLEGHIETIWRKD